MFYVFSRYYILLNYNIKHRHILTLCNFCFDINSMQYSPETIEAIAK